MVVVFFFKQETAYDMRISDWSSDVCSSDLITIEDIALQKIVIDEHTGLRGRSLRDSGIREQLNGLVVGIERDGKRILNPDSNTVFEWDDVVWVVGDRKLVQQLRDK